LRIQSTSTKSSTLAHVETSLHPLAKLRYHYTTSPSGPPLLVPKVKFTLDMIMPQRGLKTSRTDMASHHKRLIFIYSFAEPSNYTFGSMYHPITALRGTPFMAYINCYMFRRRGAILGESL